MGADVTIEGLEELMRAAELADRQLVQDVASAVRTACRWGAAEARNTKKFKRQSGALEDSIDGYTVTAGPDFVDGVVEAADQKASLLNDGTRPHDIHAKAARGTIGPLPKGQSRSRSKTTTGRLTFQTADGRWVSTPMVHHPGTSPDGFMNRGGAKAEEVLQQELADAAERAASSLSR